jgi:hypothetical protein
VAANVDAPAQRREVGICDLCNKPLYSPDGAFAVLSDIYRIDYNKAIKHTLSTGKWGASTIVCKQCYSEHTQLLPPSDANLVAMQTLKQLGRL